MRPAGVLAARLPARVELKAAQLVATGVLAVDVQLKQVKAVQLLPAVAV